MNPNVISKRPKRYFSRAVLGASVLAIALSAVIASLTVQGCRRFRALFHPADQCSLDERPVHPEMKVRVLIEGRRGATDGCCVRCAINYARQTGTTVHLISVTDYATHRQLQPDRAVYVTGSDFSPCAMSPVTISGGRREIETNEWDRCAPSSVAFANRDDAREFQKLHGGRIQDWKDLVGSNPVVPR